MKKLVIAILLLTLTATAACSGGSSTGNNDDDPTGQVNVGPTSVKGMAYAGMFLAMLMNSQSLTESIGNLTGFNSDGAATQSGEGLYTNEPCSEIDGTGTATLSGQFDWTITNYIKGDSGTLTLANNTHEATLSNYPDNLSKVTFTAGGESYEYKATTASGLPIDSQLNATAVLNLSGESTTVTGFTSSTITSTVYDMAVTLSSPDSYSGTVTYTSETLTASTNSSGGLVLTGAGFTSAVVYDGETYDCITSGSYTSPASESDEGIGTFTTSGAICAKQ